ncbi:hypothetical protein Emag_003852 [Eimeria magna]
MEVRSLAATAVALLLVSTVVVFPSSAAEGGNSEVLSNETQSMLSSMLEGMLSGPLQELLIPSKHRLELQRHTAEQLLALASKTFDTPPESYEKLKRMVARVSELEEERLRIYTSMKELRSRMDSQTFTTEEDAANRREMQELIKKLKDLTRRVDLAPVEVGIIGEQEAAGLLGMPEVKIVEQTLDKEARQQQDLQQQQQQQQQWLC